MPGPLDGIRVLDLTHVLNGPFCTMLLAHLGAEVIKIEHGEGDPFRKLWLPPGTSRDGYEFLVVNANKKCVTLNLRHPRGREILHRLVRESDVLAENFSVGTMEALGYPYEVLHEINPRLVYATSRGYGESGPYAQARAYAFAILALTGWVDKTWELSGAPGTMTTGMADEAAGVSLALGICAALYARTTTGLGQKIEVAMHESMFGFMVSILHTLFEKIEVGAGYQKCADGYVGLHLAQITDGTWRAFATALGHAESAEEPRFATQAQRSAHSAELNDVVAGWLRDKTRSELWQVFRELGLTGAPVLSVGEALADEHVKARGSFVEVDLPGTGSAPVTMLAPWIRFSDTPGAIHHAGPRLGEHNRDVYAGLLGMTDTEIDELAGDGVI